MCYLTANKEELPMRFRVLETAGREGVAVSRDGREWHALYRGEAGFPGFPDDFIAGGPTGIRTAAEAIARGAPVADIDAAHCLPPFRRAGKILCVAFQLRGSRQGVGHADAGAAHRVRPLQHRARGPWLSAGTANVLGSTGLRIELAVIIGKRARHVAEEAALDYVAGYSIFNDGSIRDVQLLTPQWTIGKNFDGTGGFGPDFVTADELPPGCEGLRMQGRLNGEVVQDTPLSDMIFNVRQLVSLLSASMTLGPGDVIVTGTPSGVGLSFKPPRFLKPGDVFEIEIEKIACCAIPWSPKRSEWPIAAQHNQGGNSGQSDFQQMGHVVISSPDPLGAAKDLQDTVGLRISEQDGETVYLTSNSRHHEVTYVKGAGKAVVLGLEAVNLEAIDEVYKRAKSDGLTIVADKPAGKHYARAVTIVAPGGAVFEIHSPIARNQPASYNGVGARPRRIEHINAFSPDTAAFGDFCAENARDEAVGPHRRRRLSLVSRRRRLSSCHCHGPRRQRAASLRLRSALHGRPHACRRQSGLEGTCAGVGPGSSRRGESIPTYYADPHGCLVENSIEMARIDSEATYEPRSWDISEGLNGRWINQWGTPPTPGFLVPGIEFGR